ncbi:Protein MtfA [Marinomonas spartinae]|uniref:M90 family metallopeptidase n=1 Tax=Marinomonas spartinae TaxID=1792290 RepID=UPI000808ABE7|nr:M90 family metallopeptidase [Marinomonas spartinae]SBS34326.1 Protein MtfA [Marinomonas spartinae]
MFEHVREWLESRRIKEAGFTSEMWEASIADWPVAARFQGEERAALRALTFRFLVRKSFSAGGDFELTESVYMKLATMACVPILHLGLNWYDHVHSIVVYEGDFLPPRTYRTADGVVHERGPGLSGEAWLRGPVILSWQSILESGPQARHGKASNVVIHEFAHKLDMLRDGANGAPPMHPGMDAGEWHDVFMSAWGRLERNVEHHVALPIDVYALTSPAEFFAVCSETFFEAPEAMIHTMPEVYRLLCLFYRQTPL